MTIGSNLHAFNKKSVQDFDLKKGIEDLNVAYRIRMDWDDYESGAKICDWIDIFCNDPKASEVTELLIGAWDFESEADSSEIVAKLVECAPKLKSLKALMIGDITYEENEMSWIQQSDMSPVLKAYPSLEIFRVRGGEGLYFNETIDHTNLKKLIVETGGMGSSTLKPIMVAQLPNLVHLELWLGTENYGANITTEQLAPIFAGKLFPKLKYLGLKNSDIADKIAVSLKDAPVLDVIETLDFSMGTIGDEGAKALYENPKVKELEFLNLNHHYMSDEWMTKMKELGIDIDVDGQEDEDDYGRYVSVGE